MTMIDPKQLTPPLQEDPFDEEERDDAIIGTAFKWSSLAILVLITIVAIVAYTVTREEEIEVTDSLLTSKARKRERPPVEIPTIYFTDITQSSGITFVHENGAYGDKLLPETMGGGCAFLDFDNDGDQDLLLVNSQRWEWDPRPEESPATTRLFENDGQGQFADVTSAVGLNLKCYGMGAAVGDYDNDGNVDIFISAVGQNHLFRNLGGTFKEATMEAGLTTSDQWNTSCAFLDYDNDSFLDLFVCTYVTWTKEYDLSQGFTLVGTDRRAYGQPSAFGGSFSTLYRNTGNGTFVDVSEETGIRVTNPDTGVAHAKSLGVAPVDLDKDGWIDLVVANDTVHNYLFHNQGGKRFEEIATLSGIAFDMGGNARGAMGIDVAPFRNNEMLGIAIGNFANEMTSLYIAQRDPLQFFDAAIATGLGPETELELTFGLYYFDYDLDGRLDLLCSNGHLEDEINKVIESQHYAQPPQLFYNGGTNKAAEFVKVPTDKVGADFSHAIVGRGASFADIDNDGDLDVLLTSVGGAPRLLRNDQALGNHWLRFKLTGTAGSRDAIGAWIDVHVGAQILSRPVMPTRSYLSQVELPVTFGLGNIEKVEKAVIRWPSGTIQTITIDDVDRLYEVEEVSSGNNS